MSSTELRHPEAAHPQQDVAETTTVTTAPLELRGVIKRFGDVVAVDSVDLTLRDAEILALVGPSGCGKSTLLRAIAGLHPIDSGTIALGGQLVDDATNHLPPERRSTGLVFQEHALFPHLSVRDNVAFGVRDESSSRGVNERVDDMLSMVNMSDYADRFPHELSGGERQRVALARALAPRPALMLFDEPFASLDHNLRIGLRRDVLAALRGTGTPAIVVTHNQREALTLGDRVAVMHRGKIEQVGQPNVVFHQPASAFVGAFMGEASFLPVSEHNGQLTTVLGTVANPNHASGQLRAMVRPDDLTFTPASDGPLRVTEAEYHGSGWLVTAAFDDDVTVQFAHSHLDTIAVGDRGSVALVPGHRQVLIASSHAPASN